MREPDCDDFDRLIRRLYEPRYAVHVTRK